MPLQFDQIVEWIDTVQLTGMDEAHEQIAHLSAFQRLVEQLGSRAASGGQG